jgi:transcriptional regulator GlxA family with amidase domain
VIRNVAVPVLDGVAMFELGVLCEVFGLERLDDPILPSFDFALCAPDAAPVRSQSGFMISPEHGLDRLAEADLIAIPAMDIGDTPVPEELLDQLRAAVDRGARVLSVCTGAFLLGEAGLLDDRRCTTQADTLTTTLEWMAEHLDEDITVETLAAQAHMSTRTFARRFRAETGTTPHHWLTGQRVLLAQRLLEDDARTIDEIATRAGFGSAALLRHHFVKRVGNTPQAYRKTFCSRSA